MNDAPGNGLILRQTEADGSEVTAIVRADSIDLYHGKRVIESFAMSPEVARRLAWFILWTWFVRATLCGYRTKRWLRATFTGKPDVSPE
jgi:hypothetical protein